MQFAFWMKYDQGGAVRASDIAAHFEINPRNARRWVTIMANNALVQRRAADGGGWEYTACASLLGLV
jgi:DNA-binding IscR family transcriptional regulator